MKPVELSEALRGLEGKWVAVREGRPIAADATPDGLYAQLHAKGERDTTIIRVPAEDEPEIVGFA